MQTKQTTLLTMGTYDVGHTGHASILRRFERFADRIVVGVNTDEFVEKYRGKPPAYPLEVRMHRIQILHDGYEVVPNYSAGQELIMKVRPDIVGIGSDWLHRDFMAQIDMTPEQFDMIKCGLLYLPYSEGVSSSEIKATLGA